MHIKSPGKDSGFNTAVLPGLEFMEVLNHPAQESYRSCERMKTA